MVGIDFDEVVVVAADFARGAVIGGDVVAGDLGNLPGEEVGLQLLGDGQLVVEHLALDLVQVFIAGLVLEEAHALAELEPLLGLEAEQGNR